MASYLSPRDGKSIAYGGTSGSMHSIKKPSATGEAVAQTVAHLPRDTARSLIGRSVGPCNSCHFAPGNLREHRSRSAQFTQQLLFRTLGQMWVCTAMAPEAHSLSNEGPDFVRVEQASFPGSDPVRPSSDPICDDKHGRREPEVPEDRVCKLRKVAESVIKRQGKRPRGPLARERQLSSLACRQAAPATCVKVCHVLLESIYGDPETASAPLGITENVSRPIFSSSELCLGKNLVIEQNRYARSHRRRARKPDRPLVAEVSPLRILQITSGPNWSAAPICSRMRSGALISRRDLNLGLVRILPVWIPHSFAVARSSRKLCQGKEQGQNPRIIIPRKSADGTGRSD